MNQGSIVQAGAPAEITRRPASEFVASFMGAETLLVGTVAGSGGGVFSLSVQGVAVEVAGEAEPGSAATVCVHPENIVLSAERPASSARNVFSGRVVRAVPLGFFQKVYIDCGFALVAYVTNRSVEELGIRAGDDITASFKATSVHVIRKGGKL